MYIVIRETDISRTETQCSEDAKNRSITGIYFKTLADFMLWFPKLKGNETLDQLKEYLGGMGFVIFIID